MEMVKFKRKHITLIFIILLVISNIVTILYNRNMKAYVDNNIESTAWDFASKNSEILFMLQNYDKYSANQKDKLKALYYDMYKDIQSISNAYRHLKLYDNAETSNENIEIVIAKHYQAADTNVYTLEDMLYVQKSISDILNSYGVSIKQLNEDMNNSKPTSKKILKNWDSIMIKLNVIYERKHS